MAGKKKTNPADSTAVRISRKLHLKMKRAVYLGRTKETSMTELAEAAITKYIEGDKQPEPSSAR